MKLAPERIKRIYNEHLKLWGKGRVIGKFHEEAGELMKALNKYEKHPTEENHSKLIGEIADVQIAVEKLENLYGSDLVQLSKHETIYKMETKGIAEKFKRAERMRNLQMSMDPDRFKIFTLISDMGGVALDDDIDEIIAAVMVYNRPSE